MKLPHLRGGGVGQPRGPITGFRAAILEIQHASVENNITTDEYNGELKLKLD